MRITINCRRRFNWIKWFSREFVFMVTLCFFFANMAGANPLGGQVVNGNVQFNTQGKALNITNSPNAIINWQKFSINADETTRFIQQNSSSSVLNRILGQDPSLILGTLQSNGRVFLINPNGILFGQGSRVDVNGLIASTLNLSNQDFLSGKYNFLAGNTSGSIQNQGTITTPSGGLVYLIAPDIENNGIINSPQGDVLLAAGHSVQLVDSLNPEIAVVVSAPADRALNLGQIVAQSGRVGILGGLISQEGTVNADSAVEGKDGKIFFKATKDVTLDAGSATSAQGGNIRIFGGMEDGTVKVAGTIDASAPNGGDGGFIETSAAHVNIEDSACVTTLAPYGKAGTWLLDPEDFTIAASGGDITGALLGGMLSSNNVTIHTGTGVNTATDLFGTTGTNGDIFVNDTVSWSANKLTLNAYRNIEINQTLNGSGSAQLALFYGQGAVNAGNTATYSINAPVNLPAGSNFSTKLGNDVTEIFYTVITDVGLPGSTTETDLQGINGNLSGYYVLGSNIDASITSTWNGGAGFLPFGSYTTYFTGTLDGLGHTITDLFINRPSTDYVGLIGYSIGGNVKNLSLVNVNITGQRHVGGFAGENNGSITDSYSTGGTVNGTDYVGCLVGFNGHEGTITNSYSTGIVSGSYDVGGLVGKNDGHITNSYSTGAVSGVTDVGGLVGYNGWESLISNSYSTGSVSGTDYVGGLVGFIVSGGTITNSYSTGVISGSGYGVGGLVGYNDNGGTITNSYSTGSVTGVYDYVGGLVGFNDGSITNSYSTGTVSGSTNVGGLVGLNSGIVTNSYWDTITSGQADLFDGRGTGKTTTEMMTQASFTAWDFTPTGTWFMIEGNTRPFLRSEYSTNITNAHQLQLMTLDLGASYTLAANIDMGELTQASGLWNTSTGFVPVGNDSTQFTGTLNGFSHTITNLYINFPSTDYIGLFGHTGSSAIIQNVGLINANITGRDDVGGLVGWNEGNITNSYATGALTGTDTYWGVGGLVGENDGTITNSHSTATVTGNGEDVGGLVGYNAGSIDNSYSTGSVSGNYYMGGLVGLNGGTISNSHYDIDNVLINGGHYVTEGGLYSDLYNQWLPTKTLNISDHLGSPDGDGYYLIGTIQNLKDLLGFIDNASYKFKLTADMDLTTLPDWHLPVFAGVEFNGAGHTLSNLSVNQPFNDDIGFIGWLKSGSTLTNLKLADVNVTGEDFVGGLVGENDGSITGSDSTGTVTGDYWTGGLIGLNVSGASISNSYSTGTVSGSTNVGGLVGENVGSITGSYSTGTVNGTDSIGGLVGLNNAGGSITNSYSTWAVSGVSNVGGLVGYNSGTITISYGTGSVTGSGDVGGLVGYNDNGTISNSYSTGTVTGSGDAVGGLVGVNYHSSISNSYSTGAVSGANYVGGLVGGNTNRGNISNSYSTGAVTGTDSVGGLVGLNSHSLISSSYSTGSATGSSNMGGLVGSNTTAGTITNSYWDTETSSQSDLFDDRGTGKTTIEMMTNTSFPGWDIANSGSSTAVWRIYDGHTYPLLRNFLTPATVTANNASKAYDGSAYSGGNGVACSTGSCDSKYMGALTYSGTSQGAINAGGYTITPSGHYSDQQGYDISVANGTLTISPAILKITIDGSLTGSVSKVYDGTNMAALNPSNYLLMGWLGSDGATVTKTTGTYNNANAGSNKTVTVSLTTSDYSPIGSTNLANYILPITITGNVGIITPASLTVTANNASKIYDGAAFSGGNGVTYSGFVNGETSSVLGGTLTYSGNSQGAVNAGSHDITPSGLTADQGNYTISYVNGALTVNKYPITITAQTNTKIYDGNTNAAAIPVITSGGPQGTDTANFSETYDTKDAGAGKTLTASGVMNDGNGGNNYAYTFITDTTGVITPDANQETSSLPQQNILYVTETDSNGSTTTTTSTTTVSNTNTASGGGDSETGSGSANETATGSGGNSASDNDKDKEKDKDKDKKDDTPSQKEGLDSGTKQKALPYCN